MSNIEEDEESVKDSSYMDDTVKDNTVSKQADTSDKTTTITDASEILGSGNGDFSLPKLSEYLGDEPSKKTVLNSVRKITGKFGPSVVLNFEGVEIRSGNDAILNQVEKLIAADRFPYDVNIRKIKSESGREYYSL